MRSLVQSQNVFLARGGKIKLGDFSISKVLERTEDFATTLTGTVRTNREP